MPPRMSGFGLGKATDCVQTTLRLPLDEKDDRKTVAGLHAFGITGDSSFGARARVWGGPKAMRATFGQRAVNAGVPIEKVSRAMRHKYTQTTERFYARVSAGVALDAVNRAFDKPAIRHRPR